MLQNVRKSKGFRGACHPRIMSVLRQNLEDRLFITPRRALSGGGDDSFRRELEQPMAHETCCFRGG